MQTAWITILLEHLVFLEANSKLQNWSNKSARKCLVIQGLILTQNLKVHPPPLSSTRASVVLLIYLWIVPVQVP